MSIYLQNTLEIIHNTYSQFTDTEKAVADFFLHNRRKLDFSAKVLSTQLHVSEAAFSRFAKKIGFSGYREFLYIYEINFLIPSYAMSDFIPKILSSYQKLLEGFYKTVNEEQLNRFSQALSEANRIYIYALGSSACAGLEFKLRFMRLGLLIDVIDNPHIMQMQAVLSNEDDLIIGISISGESKEVLSALRTAQQKRSTVFFITATTNKTLEKEFSEVMRVPSQEGLSLGDNISPQFPILIATDLIYNRFMSRDTSYRTALFQDTLAAITKE